MSDPAKEFEKEAEQLVNIIPSGWEPFPAIGIRKGDFKEKLRQALVEAKRKGMEEERKWWKDIFAWMGDTPWYKTTQGVLMTMPKSLENKIRERMEVKDEEE